MLQSPVFTMGGNSHKICLTNNLHQMIFRFSWPTRYVILDNLEKGIYIQKSIFGWKSEYSKMASQSKFKF